MEIGDEIKFDQFVYRFVSNDGSDPGDYIRLYLTRDEIKYVSKSIRDTTLRMERDRIRSLERYRAKKAMASEDTPRKNPIKTTQMSKMVASKLRDPSQRSPERPQEVS